MTDGTVAATSPPSRLARRYERRSALPSRSVRISLLVACGAYWFQRQYMHVLLPWGPAVRIDSPSGYATIENVTDLLTDNDRFSKIYPHPPVKGPETVVFHKDGTMYVLTEDSQLVRLQDLTPFGSTSNIATTTTTRGQGSQVGIVNATSVVLAGLGGGRPLGGRMIHNTLYIGDAILGLTRIQNIKDGRSKVEIVASTVLDYETPPNNATKSTTPMVPTRIAYADDVVIGPRTGRVYFTDATDIMADCQLVEDESSPPKRRHHRHKRRSWDALYASKLDGTRGKGTGRLLQYDPRTDTTTVLARGLHFANGIGVDKDETYLVFAETFGVTLRQYHLHNHSLDVLIHGRDLPGYLDGVDCSWTTNLCYAVMPSAIVPVHKLWLQLSPTWSQVLRTLLLTLPRFLATAVQPFGGLVEVNPVTKEFRLILDPTGKDVAMLTGVTVHGNKLYLGSLHNDYIGVYDLR
jgi:Strictosidine synthase